MVWNKQQEVCFGSKQSASRIFWCETCVKILTVEQNSNSNFAALFFGFRSANKIEGGCKKSHCFLKLKIFLAIVEYIHNSAFHGTADK